MRIPLIGGQNKRFSPNQDAQRTVNLYTEIDPEEPETGMALYKVPGRAQFTTAGGGPILGMAVFRLFVIVVSGNEVYRVTQNGTVTLIGTISVPVGRVDMAVNLVHCIIVSGASAWVTDGYSLTPVTDSDYPGSNVVDYIGGYFAFAEPRTQRFFISALDDGTDYNALDFASAESNVDNIVTLIVDHDEVWIFGENSTEVWYISGASDFPLARRQGATMEVGCAAHDSVAKADNTIFWLGRNASGAGVVYRADQYTPQIISNRGIEYEISRMARTDDATAYAYQEAGHTFYVLSFPSEQRTFVYDASIQDPGKAWHIRETYLQGRDRANCHVFAFGRHLVGDYASNVIWHQSLDYYDDGGLPIVWERTCQRVVSDYKRLFFRELIVNMERGVGLEDGSDPKVYLDWSDDGGHTWSSKREASMGRMGEYLPMVSFARLGSGRDRVFRLTGSESVKTVILGAYLTVEKGINP